MAKSQVKGTKVTAKDSTKKSDAKKVTPKSPVTKKATTKESAPKKKSPKKEKKEKYVFKDPKREPVTKAVETIQQESPKATSKKEARVETSVKTTPVSMTESVATETPKAKGRPKAEKVVKEKVAKAPKEIKVKPYEVKNDKELLGIKEEPKVVETAIVTPAPVDPLLFGIGETIEVIPDVTPEPVIETVETPNTPTEPVTITPDEVGSLEEVLNPNTQEDKVFIVDASNISDVVNSMPDVAVGGQTINNPTPLMTGGLQNPSMPQVVTKAITHGESILHLIYSDWRMHSWGGVPMDLIQSVVSAGSSEYQYEIKTSEKGAYFLLKIGSESHRFPQDENAFIKLK